MAAAVPVMSSIQGKLKAKIEFDPDDMKKRTFQSYKEDMTAYFDEFMIGFVLTENFDVYMPPGDEDAKKLKEYNMKIARRFLVSSVLGEAGMLARSPDHGGEPKKIWEALCAKYDGKDKIDIEAKTSEWHSLNIGRNEKAMEFAMRIKTLADDLARLGKAKDADDRLFVLRSGLMKHSRYSALAAGTLADATMTFEKLAKAAESIDKM